MSTQASTRQVYRAFSLIFRVPDIRKQYDYVRQLIYLCYTAAIALRALQFVISADPRLTAVLILIGSLITLGIIISEPLLATPTKTEQFVKRKPL